MKPFDLPTFKAHWYPVQMETVPGSGERITIAIVVRTTSGQAQARQAIAPTMLNSMFGTAGRAMQELVSTTVARLQAQLDAGKKVKDLEPPYEGVAVMTGRDCVAKDINEVFDVAIRMSAAFGISNFGNEERLTNATQRAFDEWADSIKFQTLLDQPKLGALVDAFGVPIKVGPRKKARFGFIHGSYAANFGVLRTGRANSSDLRAIKVKIFDLEMLRRTQAVVVAKTEVLVGCANWHADNPLTKGEREQLADTWEFVHTEARQRDINAVRFEKAAEAANHLVMAIRA